ncbi:hypothetical protein TRIATDRAFT_320089 [Trichoderma atroviride IMI 206040]|uniref:Uncharacterized protein n=1 Tax=Hypocrea atroviridis (strain ATCC 20476 / IMI 206040) TaxID=452589 RepID=G9P2P4_HYPAI|nr:uncharacterized protein TRIATDRAFT_320089 [Trichoderma atroviride IMI 206040]EHK42724.1 hypothetical protein TRIATDRAFT_320089 [Trichoderma atroviride IMI 206040]
MFGRPRPTVVRRAAKAIGWRLGALLCRCKLSGALICKAAYCDALSLLHVKTRFQFQTPHLYCYLVPESGLVSRSSGWRRDAEQQLVPVHTRSELKNAAPAAANAEQPARLRAPSEVSTRDNDLPNCRLFNEWVQAQEAQEARQAQEAQQAREAEGEEEDQVDGFDIDRWPQGPPWDTQTDSDDNSDSEFGWGDCDGNHPDGEHCEICASSFDCYCDECYDNGAYAGEESYHYYYRLFYWYYYFFYMDYYGAHYAERATRGSQSRHDRDDYL